MFKVIFKIFEFLIFWPTVLFKKSFPNLSKKVEWVMIFYATLSGFLLVLVGISAMTGAIYYLDPLFINKSKFFSCGQVDINWSQCSNQQFKISIKYPAKWNFEDFTTTEFDKYLNSRRSIQLMEDYRNKHIIRFSPAGKNLSANYAIDFEITEWDSEKDALRHTYKSENYSNSYQEPYKIYSSNGTLTVGKSIYTPITVNELEGAKYKIDWGPLATQQIRPSCLGDCPQVYLNNSIWYILYDRRSNITYELQGDFAHSKESPIVLTEQEWESILNQMIESITDFSS